ncbi:MAG: hypothetical protein L0332_06735 [Chloroflexi bacterium]|nr:hypothetical protein [Chloroflexota bacterium]
MTKQVCVNCHFFVKRAFTDDGRVLEFLISEDEREAILKHRDYSKLTNRSLACYHGVWDQGLNFEEEQGHQIIALQPRKGFCFFWKYRPGMLLKAASTLQQREDEQRAASRDRRLTLLGLWLAVIALVVDALLQLASLIIGL